MKATKIIFVATLLGCFLFLEGISYAQSHKEIREDAKIIISNSIKEKRITLSSLHSYKVIIEDFTDSCRYAYICLELAKGFYKEGLIEKSDSLLDETLIWLEGINDSYECGTAYFYKGLNSIKQSSFEDVILNFDKAIYYYNLSGYNKGVVYSNIQIGNYSSRIGNYIIAEEYYKKAIREAGDDRELNRLTLISYGHYLCARQKFTKALNVYERIDLDVLPKSTLARILNNKYSIYKNIGQFDKAEKVLIQSIKLKSEIGDERGCLNSRVNLFNLYIDVEQIQKAQEEYDFITLRYSNDDSDLQMKLGYSLAMLHLKKNNISYGLTLLNEYYNIKDSLSNTAFSDKLIDMQKSFELKEKDREIALLEKEDALNQARLKTKNILVYVSVGFLLLMLIVAYFINRQRKELVQSRRRLLRQKEDITGMNEQLRVSNLAKERILSVIGHDLRGPVGGLKELIELYMELPEYEPHDIDNLLKTAREASTSTYHLLENLLSWANSQRGDIVYNPVSTPLLPLIKQTVQLLDASINTRRVKFEYDIPEALVVQVDMNMLRTIIRNLVSNALKYSPEDSLINISAKEEGRSIHFCVCDQGEGMTADETERIFKKKEAYFIGTEMTAKGTGLGLILCKEFVERHGGTIWIDSEVGVGTKVCFSIPSKSYKKVAVGEVSEVSAQ